MSDFDDIPQLRSLLQMARSWGMSPGRFLGRPAVTRTVYTYDHLGRLLESVTTEDPEWTEEDREMALQLYEYELTLCSGCNQPMSETTAPENEFAYVATLPVRCHRCTTAHAAGEKAQDLPHPSALHIPIVLRGTTTDETDLPSGS